MKVCFIYNPESGSGKITSYLNWIENEFLKKDYQITFYETKKTKDAYHQALLAIDYDLILVAGGDGTLNEVVNGIMKLEKRPRIAYIPTGTVNDLGHLIGMKKNIKKTVKLILENPLVKEIDVCQINDKYFVYVAAAGRFTNSSYDISRRSKKIFGRMAYFLRGSKEIFKDYKMPIKVTSNTETFEQISSLIMILNGKRVGGFRLSRLKNKLDDGSVSLRSFKRDPWMFFRLVLFLLSGGLYDKRKNRIYQDSYFKIETSEDVSWNIDGEYMGKGPVEVKVISKAIEIIINKKNLKSNFQKVKKEN